MPNQGGPLNTERVEIEFDKQEGELLKYINKVMMESELSHQEISLKVVRR